MVYGWLDGNLEIVFHYGDEVHVLELIEDHGLWESSQLSSFPRTWIPQLCIL